MALRPKLSNNRKRKIKMLLGAAFDALQHGKNEQCEKLCSEIDAIQSGNADAAYLRGVLARDCDQCEQAERKFKQAISAAPKRADFVTALAGLYLSIGDYEQAVPIYKQALSVDPYAINAQIGLAGTLVCLARFDEAIELLEAAKKRRPGALDIRMGLFQACHDSGRSDAARVHLQDILKRAPEHAQAHYSLGLLEIESGALAAGEREIRQAIASDPDFCEAFTVLADLHRFSAENDDVVAMQKLYKRCPEGSVGRMNMAFALAKVSDDLGKFDQECTGQEGTGQEGTNKEPSHYDEAFALMQEGNLIRHSCSRYDEALELARMQQIIDACSADTLAHHSGIDAAAPIFILGMPRSGTTMVEQILAVHPEVFACGENPMFSDAMAAVSNINSHAVAVDPVAVSQWTGEECKAAAEMYLKNLRQCGANALKFTDKTLNYIVHIGSIARLLPKAKIIHLRRNALDTCLSIYKNNITGDLFDYGHDLGELGRYYRKYEKLMAHWKDILPTGMLLEIDYEQLVADPEPQIRSLLKSCGLEWHPACLDFQHADNRVLTASMTQVRQPVHTRSVGAAQYYRQHLQILVDALA